MRIRESRGDIKLLEEEKVRKIREDEKGGGRGGYEKSKSARDMKTK